MRTWSAAGVVLGVVASTLLLLSCGGGGGGTESFVKFTTQNPLTLYWSVAATDVNGDGRTDLVTTYSYDNGQRQGFLAVYLQDTSRPGNFLVPTKYEVGESPVALAVGDLNGDGRPDIVVVNDDTTVSTSAKNSISVFLQDPAAAGKFLPVTIYPTGAGPVKAVIGDLNGDGRPDIAVADTAGVSLFFQNSGSPGTFAARTAINAGVITFAIATADLNGDGRGDLVTSSNSGLQVWFQDGANAGKFMAPITYAAGSVVTYIAVGDLNKDGRPDLAVTNAGVLNDGSDAAVSILMQSAAMPGTFLAPTSYATARRSEVVAIADLNDDGDLDLAVANWAGVGGGEGVTSVLLQDPAQPGRFLPSTNYGENTGIGTWVALGDLNNDGRNDLVLVDSSTVNIRFQDAARPGTFLGRTVVAQ